MCREQNPFLLEFGKDHIMPALSVSNMAGDVPWSNTLGTA